MFLTEIEDAPSHRIYDEIMRRMDSGEEIVSLAIGEPSFETPSPIITKAYESMRGGATHYTSSFGTPEVRRAISRKVHRKNGIRAEPANTIFSTTKLAVYASLLSISQRGYEVLVPDPGYYYSDPVRMAGGRPVWYRLGEDFSLDLEKIRKVVTRRTKAIVLNDPSNPTGKVFERGELAEVYSFCRERGLYIISDESYEDLVYEKRHYSVGANERSPDLVFSLFSLSKSYAMTGWRAGYVVASRKNVKLINRFIENAVTCFPPFIQAAAAFALENGEGDIARFREELKARRGILEEGLEGMRGIDYKRTEGAFYSFPRLLAPVKSSDFCSRLLRDHNLALIPGSLFGPSGEHHLRISFGASREAIKDGTRRLGLALQGLRP